MARQVTTVAGLIRKMRKFYETHRWGRGALYTGNGGWCLLGAASAVLTNEERIKAEGRNELGRPQRDFKGYDLLRTFARFVKESNNQSVITINDAHLVSRRAMLAFLADLEKRARKAKV